MSEAKNPSLEREAIPNPHAHLLAALRALHVEVKALSVQLTEVQAQLRTITTRLFSR